MKNAPCYECREHSEECHATCERYAAYAAEREQERQRRAAETELRWLLKHGQRMKHAINNYYARPVKK